MDLKTIKGIGEKKEKILNKLNIFSCEDLIEYYPYSYIDTTKFKKIKEITQEACYSFRLKIVSLLENKKKKNIRVIKFLAMDEQMNYCNIVYFNNIFILKTIKVGFIYEMYGNVKLLNGVVEIQNPTLQGKTKLIGGIIPLYHLACGITNLDIIKATKELLKNNDLLAEKLPEYIINKENLISYKDAIKNIHFPNDRNIFLDAKKRLSFEEFFFFLISMKILKRSEKEAISFKILDETFKFIDSLEFKLTNSQKKVLDEIFKDMKSSKQMNRLLQGDVGCGKTIVAFISIFNAIKNGYQVSFMAPTEILARQHFEYAKKIFEKFDINISLLVGGLKEKEKNKVQQEIKDKKVDLVIGTHALFQEKVIYKNLGLIITDEQHRFGVKQRLLLSKKSKSPDILVMSATPIPRTIGLVMFCDLDISTIDELPNGRQKISTYFVSEKYEKRYINFIKENIYQGRQAYIVCPLVDESDVLELNNVKNLYERLKFEFFKDIDISFIHGKMNPLEKENIMNDFKSGKIKVLISTTVIEVGINVVNANIMLIYNAERFGLSQLHQLRGRVGRGKEKSYCILVSNKTTDIVKKRMDIMTSSCDGFYISQKDFLLRGYGDILGYRQSGEVKFKLIDIQKDYKLLENVKKYVDELLKEDPNLEKEKNKLLKETVFKILKKLNNEIIMN